MTDETQFSLGEHEGRLDALEKRIDGIDTKMDRVLAFVENSKGGWKTLVAGAAVVAFIVEGWHQLTEWLHALAKHTP